MAISKTPTCLDSKLPNKGIPADFSPVHGTLNENKLFWAQRNQVRMPIYRLLSRTPLSGKKNDIAYILTEFSTTEVFSSTSKKPTEQHVRDHVLSKQESTNKQHRAHVTQHSEQKTQSTRDRPKQRAATKARSHQTDDRRLARSWLAAPAAAPPPLLRAAATAVGPVRCCCCE